MPMPGQGEHCCDAKQAVPRRPNQEDQAQKAMPRRAGELSHPSVSGSAGLMPRILITSRLLSRSIVPERGNVSFRAVMKDPVQWIIDVVDDRLPGSEDALSSDHHRIQHQCLQLRLWSARFRSGRVLGEPSHASHERRKPWCFINAFCAVGSARISGKTI